MRHMHLSRSPHRPVPNTPTTTSRTRRPREEDINVISAIPATSTILTLWSICFHQKRFLLYFTYLRRLAWSEQKNGDQVRAQFLHAS